jgi:hypothetical protein
MKTLLQKTKLMSMIANVRVVLLLTFFAAANLAQAQSPIFFTSGNYANPNNWSQGSAAAFGTIVGTNIHTTTPNGAGNQYFRMFSATSGGTTYEPNGGADILLANGAVTGLQVTGSGKAYYLNIANAASNVVFKTRGSGAPGTSTIVAYEIEGAIQTVSSVAQSPLAAAVNSVSAVTVTATLSGSLATGQGIWMRYTTNNYVASTVVQLTGSGTTYTGTIPAQAAGANVSYYVFSSGTPASITGADADLATINLNNNGGSNYTYTVLPTQYTWNQTGTASWATAANWTPTRTTPANSDVLIFDNGATTTVNSVPTTQTIGGLLISNNTNVTFATATAAALTISNNVTGADLSVAAGSSLNVLSNAVQSINVATGATGSISGTMTYAGVSSATVHQLTAADASGITFTSTATFTQNTFSTGNVFGPSGGVSNSVVFASGSTFNHFAGSNPFAKTQPASVVVFNTGSNYNHTQSGGNGLSFSGRTFSNLSLSGGGTVGAAGSSATNIDNLTISNSTTVNLTMTGTGAAISSVNGNITAASGSTFNVNGTGVSVRFNGNNQVISGAGTFSIATGQTINIPSGKLTSFQSNMAITGTGALTVNGTVDMGATSLLTGTGVFTLASAGTLRTANADGIYSSTATGSIRTTTRTFNTGGNYVYNGTGNQTTGTGLPATVASLTVNNTGTNPTNVVTLTNNCTTASVVLTAGKLDLNAKTLTVSSGGTVAATAGDFTATAGPVAFAGTATVSGTVNFPTATMAGGVNFGSASNIVTSLQLNAGAFVSTNAPTYLTGSTLIYNTTGTYGRNLEWSATSGAGYPYHVQVQNGTTVNLAANGFADRAIAGNLNLGLDAAASAGSLSMGATTNKLSIGGNLVIGGNTSGSSALTLSSAIGGDIYVSGNWDTKTNGSYASNTRAVFFEGTGTATVTTIGAATFDYLFINKTSGGTVSLANDMTVNNNLTLNAQLVTNAFKVIIPTGNNVTANPNGWVRGNLQKNIPTGTNSRTFEVGDATVYAPVTTAYTGVTGAGDITVTTTDNDHPQIATSTIDAAKSVNRFYTITNSGVTGGSYDGTFTFVAGDVDGGATTGNFIVNNYVNPTWSTTTTGTRTSTTTQATGLTVYGDFQLGEPAPVTTTWTAGASTTAWATAGNWSNGVPTASDNAIIATASFYPEITTTAAVYSLTVDSGTSLTVVSGGNLTVTDVIDNDGTITVESDANLKQDNNVTNTGAGSTVVERTTSTLMRQDYVLWSSPVSGQELQAFSPATLSTRFYEYDSSGDIYTAVTPTVDFDLAKGYLIRLPNNHPATPTAWTGVFTGNPHNGNVPLTGLSTGDYYAIGNPYPSAISADDFININSVAEALYFWRKTNNAANSSYATYTTAGGTSNSGGGSSLLPDGVIQVGQGFIAKAPATSMTIDNTMRMLDNTEPFFRLNNSRSRIWLNLVNTDGYFGQALVAYMSNATNGVDAAIDGRYINDYQTALTSIVDGGEFTIQGRALPFDAADVVPLGFKTTTAGQFTIALDHVDGLFADGTDAIYLRDLLNGTEQNLRTAAYTFSTETGVFNNRFELAYSSFLSVNPVDFTANQVVLYKQNAQLVINTGTTAMASVQVFDLRGRMLVAKNAINNTEVRLTTGAENQVLLVKITAADGTVVTKKWMN